RPADRARAAGAGDPPPGPVAAGGDRAALSRAPARPRGLVPPGGWSFRRACRGRARSPLGQRRTARLRAGVDPLGSGGPELMSVSVEGRAPSGELWQVTELRSFPPPERWHDWVEYDPRAWPRK